MKTSKKLIALILTLAMVFSIMLPTMAMADGGAITLAAADAVCTGKALGKNPTTYNASNDQITNIGPDSTITYTVPEGVNGSFDLYLEVGKAMMAYGCTPFYVSVNGDDITTPIMHYGGRSTAGNAFGIFNLRENVELKAGDTITVIGQLGFEFGTFMSMMPPIRNIVLYPAGTEVGLGYTGEIPAAEETDPSDPLSGLDIIWLGSSVTYGQQGGGYSMADYLSEYHANSNAYKYAISGTTLVDETASSYVERMKHIDKNIDADYFIVQLSTNDATNNKPLGELSDSFDKDDFDAKTIYGAMEYIIAYAQETWHCPVLFYSGSYYDSPAYGNMVEAMLKVQAKWGIDVIDLYNIEEMTAMYDTPLYHSYMQDTIHPNKTGYIKWWGPEFERVLTDVVIADNHYVTVDNVTAGYGDTADVNINLKNNTKGFSSYRFSFKSDLDVVADITNDYEIQWNKIGDEYLVVVYTNDGELVFGDTSLCTITLDLTQEVYPEGEYALNTTVIDSTTADDTATTKYAYDGVLTIENPYPAGDLNLDCEITNADVVLIAKYLVKLVDFNERQLGLADVNADGIINNADLVALTRSIIAM